MHEPQTRLLYNLVMLFAPLAAALILSGTPITIEVGQKKTVSVSFPIAGGENTNPKAVRVVTDEGHQRVTFEGRKPGRSTYTVIDARSPSHVATYDVKVVAPPPPSPSPSPSASPSPTPAATAPGAGSKT